MEVADIKNYKVNYTGASLIAKPINTPKHEYINWGGHNVCIRGKDNKGSIILFNEQAVFEKARDVFYELLGGVNIVIKVNTEKLLNKLDYSDWGYLNELSKDFNKLGNTNITNQRKFGCTVDHALWVSNAEEKNRKCFKGRGENINNTIDSLLRNNETIMGICAGNINKVTDMQWVKIYDYFINEKVINYLGGYKNKVNRYKIKYN